MRFDDSLKTVLSAGMETGFGAQSTWRQLVDLMGRGRIATDEPAMARLRMLRQAVPQEVRAASARALAFAAPDAPLVAFFAEDDLAIAAPVLRMAMLDAASWASLLPQLTSVGRAVLRHRRDLPPDVVRALAAFDADFALSYVPEHVPAGPAADAAPQAAPGDVALALPVVARALRDAGSPAGEPSRSEIADLVARIEAFRARQSGGPGESDAQAVGAAAFRYETDAAGIVRWVDGIARGTLIGVSLAHGSPQGLAQVDGIAMGGFRRRTDFAAARLEVGGLSDAAGSWRLSGVPMFDATTGRFTGFRGQGRRPRADESAGPRSPAADALRQLVHELRTPTTAIAGFAELIETELLGAVPPVYRDRAGEIRARAGDLLAAIEDLDMAAQIESGSLDLRTMAVPVLPLIARVVEDLAPLATLRGASVTLDPASGGREIAGDDRAVERLFARLIAALVSAADRGERVGIAVPASTADPVTIEIDRPRRLRLEADDMPTGIDAEREVEAGGAPLLGTGFAVRLAQKLAAELGGSLAIGADRLTLRLPAVVDREMGLATTI